jgi:hypothetical protein
MSLIEFIHFAGIIIGLGAVTVIDTMGFISHKSKEWTQVTIKAHHVTKPLIWLGTLLMSFSWLFIYEGSYWEMVKSIIMGILIFNGVFLSFYISPRLDKLSGKKTLIPSKLQLMITLSFIISFTGWWSLVYLTVTL